MHKPGSLFSNLETLKPSRLSFNLQTSRPTGDVKIPYGQSLNKINLVWQIESNFPRALINEMGIIVPYNKASLLITKK